ncbi:MAG: class I SAM-dependent methyltransferase [Candidatus Binatia bacterium]
MSETPLRLKTCKTATRSAWQHVRDIYIDQLSSRDNQDNHPCKYPIEEMEEYFWGSYYRIALLTHIASKYLHQGSRILDAGVGFGFLAAMLQGVGYHAFASDIFGRHQIMAELSIPYTYWHMEAQVAPYNADHFDGIILSQTIEHFTFSPRHALSEMIRITRPKGIILIDAPNISSFRNVSRLLRGRSVHWNFRTHYLEQKPVIVDGVPYYDRHNHEYSKKDFVDIAEYFNLQLLDVGYYSSHNRWKRGTPSLVVSKLRDWVNPRWRKSIYAALQVPP